MGDAAVITTDAGLDLDAAADGSVQSVDGGSGLDGGMDGSTQSVDGGPDRDGGAQGVGSCAPPTEVGQYLAPGEELPAPAGVAGAVSIAATDQHLYLLAPNGLWRYPAGGGGWSLLTSEVGQLMDPTFLQELVVYDEQRVYWNQGVTVREWSNGTVTDHLANRAGAAPLLGLYVVRPGEIWAAGYNNTLLHSTDGVVEIFDLLSMITPRAANAALELWKVLPVGDSIAVVGVGNQVTPTLSGAVGVLGVRRQGAWTVRVFDTAPGYGFANFAAASCTGSLLIGGDYALMGHLTLDWQFTYLGGGTQAQDMLVSDPIVCGGASWIGVGAPATSLLAQIGENPPRILASNDQVPGLLGRLTCHRGVLYYVDGWSAQTRILRYP